MTQRFVLGISGASGAVYGVRLLQVLLAAGHEVHLTATDPGADILRRECRFSLPRPGLYGPGAGDPLPEQLAGGASAGRLVVHADSALGAPIASGSLPTAGMVICPCSVHTLGAVAAALSSNLLQRAAEVHLKERRPLVLVTRETPLSLIQIENMATVARAGGTILPAAPAFYHGPTGIDDLVDFIVARTCDHLGAAHDLVRPWDGDGGPS